MATPEVRITAVDIFRVEVPVAEDQCRLGLRNMFTVATIDTTAGIRGYSFADPPLGLLDNGVAAGLVGCDLFAVDDHIASSGNRLRGLEHALWDAIGKIAGQPVHRLMGGPHTPRIPVYLTCVWPGNPDQSDVTIEEQAAFACTLRDAGYTAMKIRAWRPDPFEDVRACAAIREAVGPDFGIMVDRTADSSGTLWDWPTGLAVAEALQELGVNWLEEPFARDDLESPGRLAAEVDIPITGAESFRSLAGFRDALARNSFDVVQPDAMVVGGLQMLRKVAALAEAHGVPCIPHGYSSLPLAGYLQVASAIAAPWQEVVYVVPPGLPDDLWWPAVELVQGDRLYSIADGMIEVPTLPGLGLDVDDDAVARHRVESFSREEPLVPLGAGQIRRMADPSIAAQSHP